MNKKNYKNKIIILATIGVLTRFIAMLLSNPKIFQHDISFNSAGHYDYAVYIFKNWSLPNTNYYEFAQPPINAIMQAIIMKILSPFIKFTSNNYWALFSTTKLLSFIYSCITLYIIYKILKEFDLREKITTIVFAIMALYPGLIIMATQYSNDNISYMFFYLSLYLSIRWAKEKKISSIILLALSIGIGMLTKISVGLIAFITGPMMLAVFIKSKDKKKIFIQLLVFALIVFPIGLSYSIRNYYKFDQGFGDIFEIAKGTMLDMRKYKYDIFDRFLTIPLDRIFEKKNGIYHDLYEYNVWIDMLKTSTFDEFNYGEGFIKIFLTILYIANIIFFIASIVAVFYILISIIHQFVGANDDSVGANADSVGANACGARRRGEACGTRIVGANADTIGANACGARIVGANACGARRRGEACDPTLSTDKLLNFKIMNIMIFALAIIAYLSFNIKYPYSCNSNYRYVSYITFSMASCLAMLINRRD